MPLSLSRRNFAASLLATGALTALPVASARAQGTATAEDARLMALFREAAKREDSLDPWGVLYRGGRADLAALRLTFTDAPLRARRSAVKWELAALKRIDRSRLSSDRQISYDAFRHNRREAAFWLQPDMLALTVVRPLVHFGGLHVELASLMSKGGQLNWTGEPEYRHNLDLLRVFPQVLDNAIVRFRQGLDSGVVETRMTTSNMVAQIDSMLTQSLDETQFTAAIRDFPDAVPVGRRAELAQEFRAVTANKLYPAYRRLRAFLNDEYLPAAREAAGISAMKGGTGFYLRMIENQTTLKLDPEAVHQLGLSEVARIQREMDEVRARLGFKGPLRAFFDDLRTNPRYHPKTKQELADAFSAAAKAVDAQIPKYFSKVPKTKLLIEPYPAFREQFEAGGSYNQGSRDGTRPGVFNYNTYDLSSRFLTGVVTLYLHEGAPGHHFQISLAQEDASLPDFQRFGGNNAYVEGWALYAETLGYEMGFYQDPMQHWGTLDDEMLRAMRLVVDTGLHAKGWTREQGIDFMLANSGMGRSDAIAEVERYIVWPGQALGYKVGALTIQRLRKKAEAALGKRFDIRTFHDTVLGSGALPLPILEAKVDRWIGSTTAPK